MVCKIKVLFLPHEFGSCQLAVCYERLKGNQVKDLDSTRCCKLIFSTARQTTVAHDGKVQSMSKSEDLPIHISVDTPGIGVER